MHRRPISRQSQGHLQYEVAPRPGHHAESAWFLNHRLREAWAEPAPVPIFLGPVEVDETNIGGLEKNKHANKRIPGGGDKVTVVGALDSAAN